MAGQCRPQVPGHWITCAAVSAASVGPVLVEKPFTKSVDEAAAICARARQLGILVVEAMWTRYLPQMDVARQLVASGAIGQPRLVLADFCQDNRAMARMWRKGHGSPLWDTGIYPIALCQMIFGEPSTIGARGIVLGDGMDAETTAYLAYAGGARSVHRVGCR